MIKEFLIFAGVMWVADVAMKPAIFAQDARTEANRKTNIEKRISYQ